MIEIDPSPGLCEALRWLLRKDNDLSEAEILGSAKTFGLIVVRSGSNWSVDVEQLEACFNENIGLLPSSPIIFGRVLWGMGEITARIAEEVDFWAQKLAEHASKLDIKTALEEALNLSKPRLVAGSKGRFWREAVSLAQSVVRLRLDRQGLDYAKRVRDYSPPLPLMVYGLEYAILIAMNADIHTVDEWVQSHANEVGLAAVGRAVENFLRIYHDDATRKLSRSSLGFLKASAAASILSRKSVKGALPKLEDSFRKLINLEFSRGDAVWISSSILLDTFAEWILRERRVLHLQAQVSEHPNAGLKMLTSKSSDLKDLRWELEQVKLDFDRALQYLVSNWPTEGLLEHQMRCFQEGLRNNFRLRYLIAAKLSVQNDRNHLLNKNIDLLSNRIGLKQNDVYKENFVFNITDLTDQIHWSASSFYLRYESSQRGVAKRCSDFYGGFIGGSLEFLQEPFLPVRRPEEFQSALARSILALLFVSNVVLSFPADQQEKGDYLARELFQSSLCLFFIFPWPSQAVALLEWLVRAVAQVIRSRPSLALINISGILDKNFGVFAKAYLGWSLLEFLDKKLCLLMDLFVSSGKELSIRGQPSLAMNRLLSLLDLAVSKAWELGRHDVLRKIPDLWSRSYGFWVVETNSRWIDAAEMLIGALKGDRDARRWFWQEAAFRSSLCNRIIEHEAS